MGSKAQQFHIRWNNHKSILHSVIRKHLMEETFVDVTLACEGISIKCHRIVLSASSDYFEQILLDNSEPHVVIYITDIKVWELQSLVTFMYNGELEIDQIKLPSLLKAAECLKIKGLNPNPEVIKDEGEEYDLRAMVGMKEERKEESLLKSSALQKPSFRPPPPLSQGKPFLKRKVMAAALPKLVKMQRIEGGGQKYQGQPNGGGQPPALTPIGDSSTSSSSVSPPMKRNKSGGPQLPVAVVMDDVDSQLRDYESKYESSTDEFEDTVEEDTEEDDYKDVEDDMEQIDDGDDPNEEDMDGTSNETQSQSQSGSDNDEAVGDSGSSGRRQKYGKDIKDSALSALNSGVSLRQCSEAFGIPRKTLSKWKSQDLRDSALISDEGDYEESLMVRRPGVEAGDRAERLQKAMELAMNGTTVRQAAAHYDIPRTTLCAYMKRRGVAPKRNFLPTSGIPGLPPPRRVKLSPDANVGQPTDFPFGLSDFLDEYNGGE